MELTERQEWSVMRDLVKENNREIRNVFSSAVSANSYLKNTTAGSRMTKDQIEREKQYLISLGMKEIYKACADNFFQNDFFGARTYLNMQDSKQNWLDAISTVDLFYYYNFQSRVLRNFEKVDNLTINSAVRAIDKTPLSKYFPDKITFSGKPDKTPGDKNKIDIHDNEIRAQVLHDIALREHNRYCEENGINPEEKEEVVMTKTNFGEYSGLVASRYFKQREFLQQQREEEEQFLHDQAVLENEKPKMVGFDEQQSPLYLLSNGSYQTSLGEDYQGVIYDLIDDRFVVIGSTYEEENLDPTGESEIDESLQPNEYMPLFKRDVDLKTETTESEANQ